MVGRFVAGASAPALPVEVYDDPDYDRTLDWVYPKTNKVYVVIEYVDAPQPWAVVDKVYTDKETADEVARKLNVGATVSIARVWEVDGYWHG